MTSRGLMPLGPLIFSVENVVWRARSQSFLEVNFFFQEDH